ncbi:MAG: CHAP domain-containing protein [Verrucomicrobia bacterium]|nr:MAG: CHAP domain-containing protein [Verrucomicrobiota bacterium]
MKKWLGLCGIGACLVAAAWVGWQFSRRPPVAVDPGWGRRIDSYNDVAVYYNGSVSTTNGRHLAADGYNLGLKYQCVEFVKRYYYEHLHHAMPDSYGNAKDFFDSALEDGARNAPRDLTQYTNPSSSKPRVDDLVVMAGTASNCYGHVAIVCEVGDAELTLIQQNPGPAAPSRVVVGLERTGDQWQLANPRILGWLRKQ